MLDSIMHLLPQTFRFLLAGLPPDVQASVEEIRVRESRPLEISWGDRYTFVGERGEMVTQETKAYKPTTAGLSNVARDAHESFLVHLRGRAA